MTSDFTDRLAKLCGRFGSDFDGERANAAKLADAMACTTGEAV